MCLCICVCARTQDAPDPLLESPLCFVPVKFNTFSRRTIIVRHIIIFTAVFFSFVVCVCVCVCVWRALFFSFVVSVCVCVFMLAYMCVARARKTLLTFRWKLSCVSYLFNLIIFYRRTIIVIHIIIFIAVFFFFRGQFQQS